MHTPAPQPRYRTAQLKAGVGSRPGNDVSDLKLVYTPLNGTGLEPVKKLLAKMGVQKEGCPFRSR